MRVKPTKDLKTMKTNFINSAFTGITILLLAECAPTTTAPSAPPSATVSIREWSAAYYGSAAAGKGTLYYIAATGMPATPISYAGVARRA